MNCPKGIPNVFRDIEMVRKNFGPKSFCNIGVRKNGVRKQKLIVLDVAENFEDAEQQL